MASTFETAVASKAGSIKDVLQAGGIGIGSSDIICYAVSKKENVSAKKVVALLKGRKLTAGEKARKLLGLPGEGTTKACTVMPSDVPADCTCFVQSTSHNRKVPQGATVLVLHATTTTSMKRPASTDAGAVSSAAKRRPAAAPTGGGTEKRVADLLAQFKRFGEIGSPAPAGRVPKSAPLEVCEMMRAASEWHIQKKSCGVFGLNFFDKKTGYIDKVMLMGDREMVEQWRDEHSKPNCGDDGWECIGAFSEFDYIFVNVDPASSQFGATRNITNNTFEDRPFTKAPFRNFLDKVETFVRAWVRHREQAGDSSDWEDDAPMFPRK